MLSPIVDGKGVSAIPLFNYDASLFKKKCIIRRLFRLCGLGTSYPSQKLRYKGGCAFDAKTPRTPNFSRRRIRGAGRELSTPDGPRRREREGTRSSVRAKKPKEKKKRSDGSSFAVDPTTLALTSENAKKKESKKQRREVRRAFDGAAPEGTLSPDRARASPRPS